MRQLLLLAVSLFALGCGSKTYLHVTIEGAGQPTITSIEVNLTLGAQTSSTVLTEKNSGAIALPTAVTFDLQSGSGPLTVLAIARNGAQEIVRGSGTVTITRGKTARTTITLGQIAMGDLAGSADLATGSSADLTGPTGPDLTAGSVVLSLDDDAHDFGDVEQGMASSPKPFTVTNTGTATSGVLTTALTGGSAARFAISNDTCDGNTLAPSSSCTLEIVFTPSGIGSVSGVTLDVTAAGGGSDSLTLSGTGVAPGDIGITGDPNFGTADITTSVFHDFTVTNNGGVAIGPLVVTSTDNTQFAAAQTGMTCAGTTLDPGNMCIQRVTFTPGTYGSKTSTLSIGKSGGPTSTASLTGTGRDQVSITASTNGTGTGTITGSGLNCGNGNTTCTVQITRTTTAPSVTLTATANISTSALSTWGGDCTSAGSSATCNLSMTAPHTVSATFNTATLVALTVTNSNIVSATGTVTTGDGKINCGGTCSTTYAQSSANMVTLTATPGSGFVVVWGGDCAAAGSNTTCTVAMGAARSVKAKFRPPKNIVFISSNYYTADMGTTKGVPGGDANCQAMAVAADLPGNYKAYLAGSVSGSAHLQSFNPTVRGWIRLDGVTFADTLATLNSSGPTNAPLRDEYNTAPTTANYAFWSGHQSNGTVAASNNCTNFTVTSGDHYSGNWTITGSNWQTYQNVITGCASGGAHILCMGVDYSNQP